MRTAKRILPVQQLVALVMLLSTAAIAHAGQPTSADLDAAIRGGDVSTYFADLSRWVNEKSPAEPAGTKEPALTTLLDDAAFANALAQRQLLGKHGVENVNQFAQASDEHKAFLGWLLRDTPALHLYLIGATPTGRDNRERNDYQLDTAALALWSKIRQADPDSHAGIYQKLAIATALSPPPAMSYVGAGGIGAVPIDPLERYQHFKAAHQAGELFPIFDTLTVWEYRKVVCDWASDAELTWVRNLINTWRPDLRENQQVHSIVSEVWRRNSPFFYTKGFPTVMEGGGKCGPRSWFGTMTCRAFGIPTVGVGQPGHAAFGIKAADPASQPQPGLVWKAVYGRAWEVSKTEGTTGPAFLEEAAARSHEQEFAQVEQLRWLAATLDAQPRAEAVMAVAHQIEQSATGWKPGPPIALPQTPRVVETPLEIPAGAIHIEAESFAHMANVRVLDCFTGGQQVNFQKNLDSSWVKYTLDVPAAGKYALTLRVATPNRDQVLEASLDGQPLATVPVPNTIGLWDTTAPVTVDLKQGRQTLRFTAPYQRGIAVRWIQLQRQ